jgi:hypothetical protein
MENVKLFLEFRDGRGKAGLEKEEQNHKII